MVKVACSTPTCPPPPPAEQPAAQSCTIRGSSKNLNFSKTLMSFKNLREALCALDVLFKVKNN